MRGFNNFPEGERDDTDRRRGRGGRSGRPMRHGEHPGGHHGGPHGEHRGQRAPGGRGGRGGRSRRGDVRAAVLLLLEEKPQNGYQLIQELDSRSNGMWRPSPGSIYPVLNQLEDEGLIRADTNDNGRTFGLTDAGRAVLVERRESFGQPWDAAQRSVSEGRVEFVRTVKQIAGAARQVMDAGSDAQIASASAILKDARRALYLILAEEEPTTK